MMDEEQKIAWALIGSIVEQSGLSLNEIARRAGIAPSTLSRIYPTPVVKYTLSARTIGKLKAAFPFGAEQQSSRQHSNLAESRHVFGSFPTTSGVPLFRLSADNRPMPGLPPTIEIFAGDFSSPAGYWPLTISEMDKNQFFLAYFPGDSMEPRIRAGEAILVDRFKPPHHNSDVFLELEADDEATTYCIGALRDRNPTEIVIEQPRFSITATIPRYRVRKLLHIAARFDGPLI